MSKEIFDKEETKNILNMLKSPDESNMIVGLTALENSDLKNYHGELLVLFKYSKLSKDLWEINCPKGWKILKKYITNETSALMLSSGKCLSLLTSHNTSRASKELYLECFVADMVEFLGDIGHPTDKFIIDIKLKD
jgi:hypothetical protein